MEKVVSLFVNSTKIYTQCTLCLENISKYFTANNMKETELNGYVYDFSVGYIIIDNINITNTHKFLLKKHNMK